MNKTQHLEDVTLINYARVAYPIIGNYQGEIPTEQGPSICLSPAYGLLPPHTSKNLTLPNVVALGDKSLFEARHVTSVVYGTREIGESLISENSEYSFYGLFFSDGIYKTPSDLGEIERNRALLMGKLFRKNPKYFSEFIKKKMDDLSCDKMGLAYKLDVSGETVRRWLYADVAGTPRFSTLKKMVREFHITNNELEQFFANHKKG